MASRSPRGTVASDRRGAGDERGDELAPRPHDRMRHVEQHDDVGDRRRSGASSARRASRTARRDRRSRRRRSTLRSGRAGAARSGPASGSRCSGAARRRPAAVPAACARARAGTRASSRPARSTAATVSRVASNATRAATASAPSHVLGVDAVRAPAPRSRSRAASCVRLRRCTPNVAAVDAATARARSSAAPREAPTISDRVMSREAPKKGGSRVQTDRADERLDDVEVHGNHPLLNLPRRRAGNPERQHHAAVEGDDSTGSAGLGGLRSRAVGSRHRTASAAASPATPRGASCSRSASHAHGSVPFSSRHVAAGVGVLHGLELEELLPVRPALPAAASAQKQVSTHFTRPPAELPRLLHVAEVLVARRRSRRRASRRRSRARSASRHPGLTRAVTR